MSRPDLPRQVVETQPNRHPSSAVIRTRRQGTELADITATITQLRRRALATIVLVAADRQDGLSRVVGLGSMQDLTARSIECPGDDS